LRRGSFILKNISLLGSTGYIGINSLKVIKGNPDRYRIVALGAGKNIDLLLNQIKEFRPRFAAVINSDLAKDLKIRIPFARSWRKAMPG